MPGIVFHVEHFTSHNPLLGCSTWNITESRDDGDPIECPPASMIQYSVLSNGLTTTSFLRPGLPLKVEDGEMV